MAKIKTPPTKIVFTTLTLSILLIVFGVLAWQWVNKGDQTTTQPSQDGVNYTPPTDEDKQRVEENKQRIIDEVAKNKQQATNSNDKLVISPLITYAGQYGDTIEVGGYVNGVFEDNGTCTATFRQANTTLNKSVTAVKGANSVDCPVMSLPQSSFTKGNWAVTISYKSVNASGISESKQFEVK